MALATTAPSHGRDTSPAPPPAPSAWLVLLKTSGTYADGGAVAFVSVLVACMGGDQPGLSVSLSEKSGHAIASGSGEPASVVFRRSRPLRLHVAGCSSAYDQRNIKLVAKKK